MYTELLINTDSYKMYHWKAYPPKTQHVYSYMESRGGKYDETLFFGLQGLIKEFLITPFDCHGIEYAKEFADSHGVPFNYDGWKKLESKCFGETKGQFGFTYRLPIKIKAVPEGSLIPNKNVLMTIENTDPEFPWLTSYLETMLLRLWYPITVSTRIFNMKRKIKKYYDETSDVGINPFSLLDFSSRGCSSLESNQIGGAAYLSCFMGSDSIPAVEYVNNNYNSTMSGFSVPAIEHSVTTAWGGSENEETMIRYLIESAQNNSIISLVGDTYNIFDFVEKVTKFKKYIVNKNLTVVIRPDSGSPEEVLPRIIKSLRDSFGFITNSKGYDVLKNIKILWGDGIDEDSCTIPFRIAEENLLSSDSIMVGSGGGLMQANIDRDTNKFAIKASNVTIDNHDYPIAKNPITDIGKQSKKGKLVLCHDPNLGYRTYTSEGTQFNTIKKYDILRTVFNNGDLLIDEDIDVIRARIDNQL